MLANQQLHAEESRIIRRMWRLRRMQMFWIIHTKSPLASRECLGAVVPSYSRRVMARALGGGPECSLARLSGSYAYLRVCIDIYVYVSRRQVGLKNAQTS